MHKTITHDEVNSRNLLSLELDLTLSVNAVTLVQRVWLRSIDLAHNQHREAEEQSMTKGTVTWHQNVALTDRVLLVRVNDKHASARIKVVAVLPNSAYDIEMEFIDPAYIGKLHVGQEFYLQEASIVHGEGVITNP